MRFDWYQASVKEASPDVIMATIQKAERHGDWEETRPLKNYHRAAAFVVGDTTRFKINFGGQNEEHGANVVGTGPAAQPLSEILRTSFPVHRVSRLDACEDYHHPRAYAYLRGLAMKIAKVHRVKCHEIVKPLIECDDGSTFYAGADSSALSMRIYEKGKQLDCGTEWVRVELQVRPQKEQKSIVSLLDSTEVWGLSKWSHAMAVEMGKKGLQRVDAQVWQQSDHDRAYRFMLKQYRNVLEQMLATHGSPEALGAQIAYDLEHLDLDPLKASLKPIEEV